jgi:hypothetical protein
MLDGREHLSDQYLIFSSKDAADAAHNQSQLLKFINMLFDRLREMVNISLFKNLLSRLLSLRKYCLYRNHTVDRPDKDTA